MTEKHPVIVGGNGHSGTRIFIEILGCAGVFSGISSLTKRRDSEDLRIIDLLDRWVGPFVYGGLDELQRASMKRDFARRLRILFPFRRKPWGFKNPRCMLILPVLAELFPQMRFVHVIRDGRDISLGNPFVASNRYVEAFLEEGERTLPPEQKMVLFWGRSNQRAMEYGTSVLAERYKLMRWEDLCRDSLAMTKSLIQFAGGSESHALKASGLVAKPASMGRWSGFPPDVRDPVSARGGRWLSMFGYI